MAIFFSLVSFATPITLTHSLTLSLSLSLSPYRFLYAISSRCLSPRSFWSSFVHISCTSFHLGCFRRYRETHRALTEQTKITTNSLCARVATELYERDLLRQIRARRCPPSFLVPIFFENLPLERAGLSAVTISNCKARLFHEKTREENLERRARSSRIRFRIRVRILVRRDSPR